MIEGLESRSWCLSRLQSSTWTYKVLQLPWIYAFCKFFPPGTLKTSVFTTKNPRKTPHSLSHVTDAAALAPHSECASAEGSTGNKPQLAKHHISQWNTCKSTFLIYYRMKKMSQSIGNFWNTEWKDIRCCCSVSNKKSQGPSASSRQGFDHLTYTSSFMTSFVLCVQKFCWFLVWWILKA